MLVRRFHLRDPNMVLGLENFKLYMFKRRGSLECVLPAHYKVSSFLERMVLSSCFSMFFRVSMGDIFFYTSVHSFLNRLISFINSIIASFFICIGLMNINQCFKNTLKSLFCKITKLLYILNF